MGAGVLHLVGTPIGNLGDVSDRARETLAEVDLVAAEDTRRTGRLLKHLGVRTRLLSFFEGNERERTVKLLDALRSGENVAVVSDAGMPGLSDPGHRLVRACAEEGIEVRVVPGPSAAIAALVVSGLPTDRFTFEGFPPRKAGARAERLGELAEDPRTLVLFESPRRTRTLLRDILVHLGNRRIALARELTKRHEEVIRGRVSEVLASIADRELKGEVVLVVGGAEPEGPEVQKVEEVEKLLPEVADLVAEGMRKRDAAAEVARGRAVSTNDLYRAFLARQAGEG